MTDDTDNQFSEGPDPGGRPADDQISATGKGATAIKAGAGSNFTINNSVGVSISGQTGDVTIGDVVQGDKIIQQIIPPTGLAALHQLRAPVADFVGREAEIAELVSALRGGAGVGGLIGMGGIGKTELAMVVADRLREHYPDAQILLDLQGSRDRALSPEEALRQVVRAFDPDANLPDDNTQLLALYRSLLSGKHVLILADDAKDASQLRPLLPPTGSAMIVTSRRQFTLPGMRRLNLGRLPEAAAVVLLRTICGHLSEAEAGQIAAACGRLPLALRVAAGALAADASISVEGYLGRLGDERRQLDALRDPDDPDLDVEASLTLSYNLLPAEARRDLLMLSVFAASFDRVAGAAVLGLEQAGDAESRLSELRRRSLLEYVAEEGRYDLHELVRSFALARLGDKEREARLRHVHHYITVAEAARQLYFAGGERITEGLALFDRERANLDTARRWLQAHQGDETCAALLIAAADVTTYIHDLRYNIHREWVPQLEAALAAARRLGQRGAEGRFLGNLGLAYNDLGDYSRAIKHHQQSLAIARELGNRYSEANALGNLGNVYYFLKNYPRAIDHYQESLAIACELGDRYGEANALGNLGLAYNDLGDCSSAIDHHHRSLAIARELGDRKSESRTLGHLGNVYKDLSDYHRTIDYYQQSLAIARELGDRYGEANALYRLGLAYSALCDYSRAIDHHNQALAIARELGDRNSENIALGNLGNAYGALGDYLLAIEYHQQRLPIARELGDLNSEANANWNLGIALIKQDEPARALPHLEAALAFRRVIDHPDAENDAPYVEQVRRRLQGEN